MDRAEALSGFTEGASIVLPYGGQFASDSTIDSYLDEDQRLGIKVIVDFHTHPGVWSSWPSAEELAQKADRHKDHPAVHGWYIADEPNYNSSNETPQYMENIYNQIKSKDPDYPIFIVHKGRMYDSWVNAMDVLMLDHYPGWTLYDPDEFNWMVRKSYSVWLDGVIWVEQHGKEAFIAVPMGFGANEDGKSQERREGFDLCRIPLSRVFSCGARYPGDHFLQGLVGKQQD